MKAKKLIYILAAASTCCFALAGCGEKEEDKKNFDFSIALQSGKSTLEVGEHDQIVVQTNQQDDQNRVYTYSSSNAKRAEVVEDTGYVTVGTQTGSVKLIVKEQRSNIERTLDVQIADASVPANGGYNYSAAAGAEAIQQRTEILGKLEKYAVESHLTGITLFENGGYVKYNPRLVIPAKEYITGYGFGILSEGSIDGELINPKTGEPTESNPTYKPYYHSAQTQNPNTINAWNASGSQVSDLSGYITSTYWNTKMNKNKDGYEWYPQLALDEVGGKVNDRPIPVYDKVNPLGLYKTWKIYVKTGAQGLKYRYSGATNNATFENRPVDIKDYAFVFQLLLTGANKQSRGAEMAGDKTYGIKGAQSYYTRTKELTDQTTIDNVWNEMTKSDASGNQDPTKFSEQSLGIMTGSDANGSYIQLELINEIDAFTAMYTLSSSLYSPIPRAFIEELSKERTVRTGVLNYGRNSSWKDGDLDVVRNIVDNTISLSAYKLDVWNDSFLAFGRNDGWVERAKYPERNTIAGIKINNYINATQDQLYMYYNSGLTDSCGVPITAIDEEAGKPDTRVTKGDSTFKLNVNSCTQERWNELFGPGGQISSQGNFTASWNVKPWMSNENFLNGLYWSINREEFARKRGVQPSIDYFAGAYLSDPENGVSYNDSPEHKAAVAKWHTVRTVDGEKVDNYGFDYSKAVACFKTAVNQLVNTGAIKYGTKDKPTEIHIHIRWMYQTDINEYGDDIGKYFTDAFNDEAVCGGKVKLVVDQEAVTNWEDVYNLWMMKGQFDLAFGAISGNTYNPLNFLEVLKSDNSSGFTLNWGPDTSKIDSVNPLVYDGYKWSFDSLWEVADRGGVVENGVAVKTVKNYYFDGLPKDITTGKETSDYSNGATFDVKLEFVDVEGVEIELNKVQIYTVGSANTDITSYTYDKDNKVLHCTLSKETAAALKAEMVELNNKGKNPGDVGYVSDPFTRGNYGIYWTLELYYSLSIRGGTPSQSFVTVAKTQSDQPK